MKLFRFTFIHGSYDVGQAVVVAETMEEAEHKLAQHCESAHPEQGRIVGRQRWLMSTIQRDDPDDCGLDPTEIDGDVALTYGVDG